MTKTEQRVAIAKVLAPDGWNEAFAKVWGDDTAQIIRDEAMIKAGAIQAAYIEPLEKKIEAIDGLARTASGLNTAIFSGDIFDILERTK